MQNFPQRLEFAIQKSGRPKGDLAAHCGVALSTVSRWLAGSVPKAETLERISQFLGVDAKWLVFGGAIGGPDENPISERAVPLAEPTMKEAFQKLGEAIELLQRLLENQRKS